MLSPSVVGFSGEQPLRLMSGTHVAAIVACVLACVGLIAAARLAPGPWILWVSRVLAAVMFANEVTWWAVIAVRGEWAIDYALPLYLCDAAGFVTAAALWTRQRTLVEITYFWGLAGTIQAVLTPDLHYDFPSYFYFQYWLQHIGIVAGALFLVVGLRIYPRPGAVLRVLAITVIFTVTAGIADVLTGGNYMYLHYKPPGGSLLDYLGPWPVYIAAGVPLAIGLLVLLDIPFWRGRRRAAR